MASLNFERENRSDCGVDYADSEAAIAKENVLEDCSIHRIIIKECYINNSAMQRRISSLFKKNHLHILSYHNKLFDKLYLILTH